MIKLERTTDHFRDRYHYDRHLAGYAQVDTRQDAPYFGTWLNPVTRTIVCYCEGDLTTTTCDTDEELRAEVERMKDYYGDGFRGIDPGWPETAGCDAITEALQLAGLGAYVH